MSNKKKERNWKWIPIFFGSSTFAFDKVNVELVNGVAVRSGERALVGAAQVRRHGVGNLVGRRRTQKLVQRAMQRIESWLALGTARHVVRVGVWVEQRHGQVVRVGNLAVVVETHADGERGGGRHVRPERAAHEARATAAVAVAVAVVVVAVAVVVVAVAVVAVAAVVGNGAHHRRRAVEQVQFLVRSAEGAHFAQRKAVLAAVELVVAEHHKHFLVVLRRARQQELPVAGLRDHADVSDQRQVLAFDTWFLLFFFFFFWIFEFFEK